jgi:peptidoglycan biosynthesis protein MviN/MurJ (putative lipid II flippase)
MKRPVRVAGVCLLVNIVASLLLMQLWGAIGLAAANVLAAVVQSVLLWRALATSQVEISFSKLQPACIKILAAGIVMALFCAYGASLIGQLNLGVKLDALVVVGLLVPSGAAVYLSLLYFLRFEELETFKNLIGRFIGSKH